MSKELFNKSEWQFRKSLLGPETFSGRLRNGSLVSYPFEYSQVSKDLILSLFLFLLADDAMLFYRREKVTILRNNVTSEP